MAVGFRSVGTPQAAGTTSPASVTPSAPAGMETGDLVIVVASWDTANTTATDSGITTSTAGWSAHPDVASTTSSPRQYIKLFYKFADSPSMAMPSVTFTGGTTGTSGHSGSVRALAFTDVDTTTPFGTSGANYGTSSTSSTIIGTILAPAALNAGELHLAVGTRSDDSTGESTVASGFVKCATDYDNTNGGDQLTCYAYNNTSNGSCTFSNLTSATVTRAGRMWTLIPDAGGGAAAIPNLTLAPYMGAR